MKKQLNTKNIKHLKLAFKLKDIFICSIIPICWIFVSYMFIEDKEHITTQLLLYILFSFFILSFVEYNLLKLGDIIINKYIQKHFTK